MTALIATPFSANTTAAEAIAGIDLTGKRAVVTGGASGIGVETARALAAAGAEVTLAVRNTEAGEQTKADIVGSTKNDNVLVASLDLSDRTSIAAFVEGWAGPVHILINNAGMMASPLMRTPEGWEMQWATNHLGHFALATGLHDALASAGGARVVSVSSSAHERSAVVFDDLHFQNREYEPWSAYGQSKTSNILFAVEASSRWADDGIVVNSLHPGGIRTNLQRYVSEEALQKLREERAKSGGSMPAWKSVEQGAATSIVCATSPLLEGHGGRYFYDCNEAPVSETGTMGTVATYAVDKGNAARLWDLSLEHLAH